MIVVAGDEDDGTAAPFRLPRQGDAILATGQANIDDHCVEGARSKGSPHLLPIPRYLYVVALFGKDVAQQLPNTEVILDHQNAAGLGHRGLAICSAMKRIATDCVNS